MERKGTFVLIINDGIILIRADIIGTEQPINESLTNYGIQSITPSSLDFRRVKHNYDVAFFPPLHG